MPSRMLVAETARMAAAGAPERSSASRDAGSQIELPVGGGVEHLRPGHAGLGRVGVLALADRDLVAVEVEQHRPHRPGARIDREQVLTHSAAARVAGASAVSGRDDALTCTSTRIRSVRSHDR